ncbi:MAG: hypothetical protein GWO24_16155, partial [Akkermansiaceae bacterium]|nr:hypothetical protein [Akkermansiaceae bacterium]
TRPGPYRDWISPTRHEIGLVERRAAVRKRGMGSIYTIAEGRFLGLYERDNWEFAARPNAESVVGILAHSSRDEFILIEQYRAPLQARVVE